MHQAIDTTAKLRPADLVAKKPEESFLWRQEAADCVYDHATQTRHWEMSDKVMRMIMSTGAPTSSTAFDGEGEE